jgi:GNAT superfamily N-acetyltransferase
MPGIEFRDARVDAGPGGVLAQAMRDEIAATYDGLALDGPAMPKAGPAELSPPRGAFIVGWLASEPICCGGLKQLPDGTCEIKKMYVVPAARGRGVARVLLRALEDRARLLGYSLVRLDTGPKQAHARALYESDGYRAIDNFNANPVATFFGEKDLRLVGEPAGAHVDTHAARRRSGPG